MEKLYYPENKTLLPFQEIAIQKMLQFLSTKPNATYNACEMGLGKSVQAIVAINTLKVKASVHTTGFPSKKVRRTLIVCPSIMKHTWLYELMEWGIDVGSVLILEKETDLKKIFAADTVILSYGLVVKFAAHLKDLFYFLVLDESHYVAKEKSQRAKAVFTHLWPTTQYKIALSGTPFTNCVIDGFSLFSRMYLGFGDYWRFASRYTNIKHSPWGKKPEGLKNSKELSQIIRTHFYVRYLKKDVMKELPEKVHKIIYLPETFAIRESQAEKRDKEEYVAALKLALSRHSYQIPHVPFSIMTKRQEQGEKKIPFVIEYVNEFLLQNIPVILFGVHVSFIKALAEHFKEQKPAVIIGETPTLARTAAIERFQSGATKLFIGNTQAAGVGITLTAASNVILAEFDFIPSTISQAIARAHRIGQKESVTAHYLVVQNSLEEKILKAVIKKQDSFNKVLDQQPAA